MDDLEPLDPEATGLTVEVMGVRWRSPGGDFAVLYGPTPDGEHVVVTGAVGHVHEGETITVGGRWSRHARHGWRFEAERLTIEDVVSERGLLGVLAAVKHVGPTGARWLLESHGESVLDVIDGDPGRRLREVPGIGAVKIGPAVRSWEEGRAVRAVRLFLEQHGVEAAAAQRIYRHLGTGSIELLRADPYALTDVPGIGFATADALARALGVEEHHPRRLQAGTLHVLALAELDGHCHLPRAELEQRAGQLLGAEGDEAIDALAAAGRVVIDEEGRVADAQLDRIERDLAGRVDELLRSGRSLHRREVTRPPRLTDAQWGGVQAALENRLSVLTGLPGTGKTQTMRALVDVLRSIGATARLCAPTGKAARRLSEVTGAEASTIHRLLEWQPPEGFARGPDHPLEGIDVLIVDEASMLGLRLAAALFGAVGPRAHVLLVGDVDQLPPVGPGRVLDDLIASERVPTTRLTEIFRQAARSLIVQAAHAINAGKPPPRQAAADGDRDFFVIDERDPGRLCDLTSISSPAGCPSTTTSTRCRTSRCWPPCTAAQSGSTCSTTGSEPA